MADQFELTDKMRSKIGWESQPWEYEVTSTSVRAFARGVGYTDPVYFDVNEARKAGYRDLPAPPTYLGTPVFIPGKSSDTFSYPPDARPDIQHGLKGLLDGGTEIEYLNTICAGDTLTVFTRLADLDVKESKSLGKMLIASSETIYKNNKGKVVAICRNQAIYY